MSRLLSLPPQLRQRIWEMALLYGPADVQLIRTCQQIHSEAEGIIFRRPLRFASQNELQSWLQGVRENRLPQVEILTLYLQDLEVLPLNDDLSWPSVSLLERYQQEAKNIIRALKRFPSIHSISLHKPDVVRSYLYQDFYFSVLKKISLQYPALRAISFYSDEHPLDFLKSFQDLRQLQFTGYSKSTPMETLNVLSRLRHLSSIELMPPTVTRVVGGLELDSGLPNSQSLTRDVIKGLRGLREFKLQELTDRYTPGPAFFKPHLVQAIDSGHRVSLQRLSISLNFTPDSATQGAFHALLKSSSVRHLDIVWPRLGVEIMQALPPTIETLREPPIFGRPPYWILVVIQWRRAELPALRELRLVCESESGRLSSQAISTQAFRAAVATVRDLGIQTYLEQAV